MFSAGSFDEDAINPEREADTEDGGTEPELDSSEVHVPLSEPSAARVITGPIVAAVEVAYAISLVNAPGE